MWKAHMNLHAQNVLPGDIPIEWLEDQDSYICQGCHQIISNSRLSSHSSRCGGLTAINTPNPTHLQPPSSNGSPSNVPLPTFNEVCQLNLPTLPFIPTKAKPAFAKARLPSIRSRGSRGLVWGPD